MERVYTQLADEIFTLHNMLVDAECEQYVSLGESIGFAPAPIQGAFGPAYEPNVRNNQRVMIDDPLRAAVLCERA